MGRECVSGTRANCEKWRILIVSKLDSLTIKSVVVNRGTCPLIAPSQDTPLKLKFGEEMDVYVSRCNLFEVKLSTEEGDGTYTTTWEKPQ
jgi:hypothetical protein